MDVQSVSALAALDATLFFSRLVANATRWFSITGERERDGVRDDGIQDSEVFLLGGWAEVRGRKVKSDTCRGKVHVIAQRQHLPCFAFQGHSSSVYYWRATRLIPPISASRPLVTGAVLLTLRVCVSPHRWLTCGDERVAVSQRTVGPVTGVGVAYPQEGRFCEIQRHGPLLQFHSHSYVRLLPFSQLSERHNSARVYPKNSKEQQKPTFRALLTGIYHPLNTSTSSHNLQRTACPPCKHSFNPSVSQASASSPQRRPLHFPQSQPNLVKRADFAYRSCKGFS